MGALIPPDPPDRLVMVPIYPFALPPTPGEGAPFRRKTALVILAALV